MSPVELGSAFPTGEWEIDGWRVKVEQGRKVHMHRDDRKIWVASPGGNYRLLTLASLGVITSLWYRNEELLYPSPATGGRFRGGEMVLDFLRDCVEVGIEKAAEKNNLRPPRVRRLDETEVAA